jgi:hypothetical protein
MPAPGVSMPVSKSHCPLLGRTSELKLNCPPFSGHPSIDLPEDMFQSFKQSEVFERTT